MIAEFGVQAWVVLDRLDEAFSGFAAAEVPALRALLRAYLDLLPYRNIRLKLFVRRDLFRRIVQGGFVNLTHINARKLEISWTLDDLFALLCRRFAENPKFLGDLDISSAECESVFNAVFPEKVDPGGRKPTTWVWMMGRIRDGNDVRPPRNLIDLVKKAQHAQLRKEEQEARQFDPAAPLIGSDAIKLGLRRLSEERVQDTLLAEAGDSAYLVELFAGGKAEHSLGSLEGVLKMKKPELDEAVRFLTELGFLERVGENFKVPMLYREGLGITQGKAVV